MKILLSEPDAGLALSISDRLKGEGFQVVAPRDSVSVYSELSKGSTSAALFDLDGNSTERLGLLAGIRDRHPQVPVLLLANGTPSEVVEHARALGASQCLHKPVSLDELATRVRNLLGLFEPPAESPEPPAEAVVAGMIWPHVDSELHREIRAATMRDITVLITGETGTGKGVTAQEIHALSRRRKRPFKRVNCAGLSATLLESELFGHEKGAFTGAQYAREGRFELAERGTILLDDIGDLDLPLQAKLLRVLQEREFERVGSSTTRKVDVRVIATTNRDLTEDVNAGRFRVDLFYRLNVFPIKMPSLRDRLRDIPQFVERFLKKPRKRMDPEALDRLIAYEWPGNIRELENLMARLSAMVRGNTIRSEHLPPELHLHEEVEPMDDIEVKLPLKEAVQKYEMRYIRSAIRIANGNKTHAAELLGVKRTALQQKLGKTSSQSLSCGDAHKA